MRDAPRVGGERPRGDGAAGLPDPALAEGLRAGLAQAGLVLPAPVQAVLLGYVALLCRWNRAYNLTGVRAAGDMVRRHLLDCLVVLPHVHGRRLVDVGSGAGLPGLVLAAARAELGCVLVEASGKKARFCRHAAGELGLDNVQVVQDRVERYAPQAPFDTVIARGFADLATLEAHAARLRAPGGRLLAMKGRYPGAELTGLGAARGRTRVVPLQVPGLAADRHLVIVEAPA